MSVWVGFGVGVRVFRRVGLEAAVGVAEGDMGSACAGVTEAGLSVGEGVYAGCEVKAGMSVAVGYVSFPVQPARLKRMIKSARKK